MQTVYSLRKNSVIFHPIFDSLNAYSTYVFDVATHQILKLEKSSYILLYYLSKNPRSTEDGLVQSVNEISRKNLISISESEIKQIINYFVKKEIIQIG